MESESATISSPLPVIEMTGVAVGSVQDLAEIRLEDVNWTVNPGDFWVIAGMHASGKTDLMWMTAGIMPSQGGMYRLFGHEMPMYDEDLIPERLRLGLAFENGQLLRHLNVHENVILPLRYHRDLPWAEAEDRVKAMLEKTELAAYSDSMP